MLEIVFCLRLFKCEEFYLFFAAKKSRIEIRIDNFGYNTGSAFFDPTNYGFETLGS
jgi:hypothetical protein